MERNAVLECICHKITSQNMRYAPGIIHKLISISRARRIGFQTIIDTNKNHCQMGKIVVLHEQPGLMNMADIRALEGLHETVSTVCKRQQVRVVRLENGDK